MKRLHGKVNIVPVIAKADSLTKPELKKLKISILHDIRVNEIKVRYLKIIAIKCYYSVKDIKKLKISVMHDIRVNEIKVKKLKISVLHDVCVNEMKVRYPIRIAIKSISGASISPLLNNIVV